MCVCNLYSWLTHFVPARKHDKNRERERSMAIAIVCAIYIYIRIVCSLAVNHWHIRAQEKGLAFPRLTLDGYAPFFGVMRQLHKQLDGLLVFASFVFINVLADI